MIQGLCIFFKIAPTMFMMVEASGQQPWLVLNSLTSGLGDVQGAEGVLKHWEPEGKRERQECVFVTWKRTPETTPETKH